MTTLSATPDDMILAGQILAYLTDAAIVSLIVGFVARAYTRRLERLELRALRTLQELQALRELGRR